MKLNDILAVLITLSAVFSYLNYRTIRLPGSIGLMLIALLASLALMGLKAIGLDLQSYALQLLNSIDFDETLLHGMLSFLLFAGALHINLNDLVSQKSIIAVLATVGVIGATFLMGLASWWIFTQLGFQISLVYCLLFGALIAPTDPVAVLSILRRAGVPKSLETIISGESLFNDGVAVVVFMVLLKIAAGSAPVTVMAVTSLFLQEALGGILFGLGLGGLAYLMLKSVDNYQVEVLITLALVAGGFALADRLHLSGPIAIVVAGLLIGNHGRLLAMSGQTRGHLDTFWELVDEILNAVLFVLIGLEVLVLTFTRGYVVAGLAMIPLMLAIRYISVGIPVIVLRFFRTFSPHVVKILTWGGLRGGISVALALSIPAGPNRGILVVVTYCIVVFSIVVQGLTIGKLVRISAKHP